MIFEEGVRKPPLQNSWTPYDEIINSCHPGSFFVVVLGLLCVSAALTSPARYNREKDIAPSITVLPISTPPSAAGAGVGVGLLSFAAAGMDIVEETSTAEFIRRPKVRQMCV